MAYRRAIKAAINLRSLPSICCPRASNNIMIQDASLQTLLSKTISSNQREVYTASRMVRIGQAAMTAREAAMARSPSLSYFRSLCDGCKEKDEIKTHRFVTDTFHDAKKLQAHGVPVKQSEAVMEIMRDNLDKFSKLIVSRDDFEKNFKIFETDLKHIQELNSKKFDKELAIIKEELLAAQSRLIRYYICMVLSLAVFGYEVICVLRNPIPYKLIKDPEEYYRTL